MKRNPFAPYGKLILALVLLLSIPASLSQSIRGRTVGFFSPVWNRFRTAAFDEEKNRLLLENALLKEQLATLEEMARALHATHTESICAQVVFRSPSSWDSSLWISAGEEQNCGRKQAVIAKDSPVVVGDSLVGIVDYVGERQSRVRLLTDSGLCPSVRSVRGTFRSQTYSDQVHFFLNELLPHPDLALSKESRQELGVALSSFQCSLEGEQPLSYLAKGELRGASLPLWQRGRAVLHGIGFNYDFSDDKGPARDLRTGAVEGENPHGFPAVPLLQSGDLLVTTGLDGLFPEGLSVAKVTRIFPLKEGDYYYELEATPTAPSLDRLRVVSILPPQQECTFLSP